MVLSLPTEAGQVPDLQQGDVRETPAGSSTSTSSTSILAPIGSIMPWLKSFTNTPATLPTGWMEADGSAISDADSVYNGQNAPDLNGNEFVRGAATSGGTGGGTTGAGSAHTHTQDGSVSNDSHSHTLDASGWARLSITGVELNVDETAASSWTSNDSGDFSSGASGGASGITEGIELDGATNSDSHGHNDTFSNANESAHTHTSAPKFYNVVWIFRFK